MISRWAELFIVACELIEQVNTPHTILDRWSFGGGTAMMLQIDHRESHDIDIFLDDPQLLSYLNPATQSFQFTVAPSAYDGDGTHFQKLVFPDLGEIDFIVASDMTPLPAVPSTVLGWSVNLETVEEIISKKIFYRGSTITPRDIFDVAAACHAGRRSSIIEALSSYPEKCTGAINAVSALRDEFLAAAIGDLEIKVAFSDIRARAKSTCLDVLRDSVARAGL